MAAVPRQASLMRRTGAARAMLCLLLLALASACHATPAADNSRVVIRTEQLSSELELAVTTHAADGDYLLLWIAASYGFRERHAALTTDLVRAGFEIWQADLADALFLPRGSASMRKLDGEHVADLVQIAHRLTGKQVVLVSGSYGAIPVLRGARHWQSRNPARRELAGAVLFTPNLYSGIPPLGTPPEYVPIVHATTIPVWILQASRNSNRWQLSQLVENLRGGGASVYVEMLRGATALFYEEDSDLATLGYLQSLPQSFKRAAPLLANAPMPLSAAPLPATRRTIAGSGLDSELQPYRGERSAQPIRLEDVTGRHWDVSDYRGRVTVVNFWATWCPPCVKEIPSLNRLRQSLADTPFELISVNYAQRPDEVAKFSEKVNVDFPVLLDSDGRVSAQWGVIAFPSTFVIGPDGRIQYGVNAAIHWDSPQVIERLRVLAAPR
ncbi:MAG: TlpA family protein disulfide reductase [Pseudomonadota bacterium]|nr:MAG: TlpA family protein disulfide reductase [Pseudomonadota bacterium]